MSSKHANRTRKASTTLLFKDMIQNLRERIGFGDDEGEFVPSNFEALESRVLLSANPLSEIDARHRDYDAGVMLNDMAAIYTTTGAASSSAEVDEILTSSLARSPGARSDGPAVEVIHNAGAEIRVGDTVNFFVQATDSKEIVSRTLSVNGQTVALDSAHSADYAFDAPGEYVIVASATNVEGVSQQKTISLTVVADQAEPPVVTIAHNAGQNAVVAGQTLVFDLSVDGGTNVKAWSLTVNGEDVAVDAQGRAEYTFERAGIYTIIATAEDDAGNVGSQTMVIGVPVSSDIEAPAVGIDHDAPSVIHPGQTVHFTVTATDNVGVASTQFTVNGRKVALDANGEAEFTFTEAGVYKIVATAFDVSGNLGMQTITLHVVAQDVAAPAVAVTTDAAGQVQPGQTVTFTVNATDNVGVTSRWLTVNGQEVELDAAYRGQFTFAASGTYVIVGTAVDASGNIGMQTITLTVAEQRDMEAPTVNIVHNAKSVIRPGDTVDFTVVATDNVGVYATALVINGRTVSLDADGKAAHTFTAAGTYTVMAIASDETGNINTKTIVLTVSPAIDHEAPVVSIAHNGAGTIAIGQSVDFTVNASDNVGVVARTLTINGQNVALDGDFKASHVFAAAGTYAIVATATDAAGNTGTQTLYLTVADNRDIEAPVISITHNGGQNIQAGQLVEFTVTATDNVAVINTFFMINGQTVALDAGGHASYTFASAGVYAVTAVAVDSSGNIGTGSLTIEVSASQDVEPPAVVIRHDSDGLLAVGQQVIFTVSATDNVGVAGSSLAIDGEAVALDASGQAVYAFATAGTHTITARVWDAAGNVGTQTISLVVYASGDVEAPQVDVAHNAGTGDILAGQEVEFTITAHDNVGVTGLGMTINGRKIPVGADGKAVYTFASAGIYTVIATATDAAGNTSAKTLVVVVAESSSQDSEAPVVEIAHNARDVVYIGNTVEFTVKATDNVGVVSQTFTVNGYPMPLVDGKAACAFISAGVYEIISTATDAAGNTGTSKVTLEVIKDVEAPTVDIEYAGGGTAFVGDAIEFTVVATDNDGVTERKLTVNDQVVELVDGKGSFTFAASGVYTVVASAKDAAGNENFKSVTITVTEENVDDTEPVVEITRNGRDLLYVGNGVEFTVKATDDVGVLSQTFTINGEAVTLDAYGKAAFVFTAAGRYEVVATATDAAGNTGTSSLTITVLEDVEAPTVDIEYAGGGTAFVGDAIEFTVVATDNDGVTERKLTVNDQVVELVDGKGSFTFAASGVYTVVASAKDAAGNENFKSVTITVTEENVDDTEPVVEITHNGRETIYVGNTVEFMVKATDDVGVLSQTFTINGKVVTLGADGKAVFTFTDAGNYEIVSTATDAAGNTGTSRIVVSVVEDIDEPEVELTHNGGSVVYTGNTLEFTLSAEDNDGVTERRLTVNGQVLELVAGKATYTFSSAGTYNFVATAKDAAGNEGSAFVSVTVEDFTEDKERPVVNLTHDFDPELQPGGFANFKVTAYDNVGVSSIILTVNGKQIPLSESGEARYQFTEYGTYRVEAVAVDAAGNAGRSMVVLLVKDPEAPTVYISHYSGNPIITDELVYFTVNTISKNTVSKVELIVNGRQIALDGDNVGTFTFTAAGTYVVQAVVEDERGNSAVDTYYVTVEDDTTAPLVEISHNAPKTTYVGTTVDFEVKMVDYMGVTSQTFTINGVEVPLDADGRASYTFTEAGTYEIVVTAMDAVGNMTTKSVTITVVADTTAPRVSIRHDGDPKGILTCDIVTFTVSASDNVGVTKVKFTIDDVEYELSPDGKFAFNFATPGLHTIVATAWDAAGNEGSRAISITVYEGVPDTTPPVVSVSHNYGKNDIYVGNDVTFSVSAKDNVIVAHKWISVNGREYGLNSSGKATFTFAEAGTYEVIGYASDGAGNVGSYTISITVVVDTEAPVVDVTHDGGDNLLPGDKVTFAVTATDNDAVKGKSLTVNGETVALSKSGKGSFTFAAAGVYEVIATAWDAAGNESSKTITVTVTEIDETAPVVKLSSSKTTAYIGNTITFTVAATDNVGVESRRLTINGQEVELAENGKAAYVFTAAGEYEVVATVRDAAGNETVATLVVTIVEDTVPPSVRVTHNGSANILPGDSVVFSVNASDNDSVAGKKLTINGEEVELSANGKASFTFTEAGTYEVIATAWDPAGNEGVATITVTVMTEDTTAPTLSLTRSSGQLYAGSTVVFTLKAADNVGVTEQTITVNGVTLPVGEDGKATYIVPSAGTYTVVATVRDAAGNETSKTISFTAVLDNVDPKVALSHNGGGTTIPAGKTVDFTVKATDNVGVQKYFLAVNGETVVLDSDNMGSYTFAAPGTYEVVASAKDAMGNEASQTVVFTVVEDTTAPVVTVAHNGRTTNFVGGTLTFTVAAKDDVGVKSQALFINGEEVALLDGVASYTFTQAGSYTVLATATDFAGNEGSRTITVKVSVDATAPKVNLTHDGGNYIAEGDTVEFTMTASDNNQVVKRSLTINGEEAQLDENGKICCVFSEAGRYEFVATAIDAAGNIGTKTLTIDVVVPDVEAPTVTLTHNAKETVYVGNKVSFTIAATDDGTVASRTLTINGKAVSVNSRGVASYTFTAAGAYEIVATATDAAGNAGIATTTIVVVADEEAPVVGLTHNGGDAIVAGAKVQFTLTASDNDDVAKWGLTVNGAKVTVSSSGKATYTFTEPGTYTIVATAYDKANNAGTMEIVLTVL